MWHASCSLIVVILLYAYELARSSSQPPPGSPPMNTSGYATATRVDCRQEGHLGIASLAKQDAITKHSSVSGKAKVLSIIDVF